MTGHVYSEDRQRRLGWVLKAALFFGSVIGGLGVVGLVAGSGDLYGFWVRVTVSAVLILGTSALSLRTIGDGDPRARTITTVCGTVTLVGGAVQLEWIFGFLLLVLGIAVLLLARLNDDPEGAPYVG